LQDLLLSVPEIRIELARAGRSVPEVVDPTVTGA